MARNSCVRVTVQSTNFNFSFHITWNCIFVALKVEFIKELSSHLWANFIAIDFELVNNYTRDDEKVNNKTG